MKKKNKLPSKLVVTIDASHTGIVNGNMFMYLPDGMRGKGEESFTKPYNKPVTDGHPGYFDAEKDYPVLGRIISAEYRSYGNAPEFDVMNVNDEGMVDMVQKIYRMQHDTEDYKGTGSMVVKAEIIDSEAIQEIMDKRKITVSIGAFMDNSRCSVCGTRWGDCEHDLSEDYDGKVAFRVGGKMRFDHLAFVKRPADGNAQVSEVQSISDNETGKAKGYDLLIYDEVQITDTQEIVEDEAEAETKSFKDAFVALFDENMKGREEKVIKQELLDSYNASSAKGRSHSFLFADTKEVFLKDNTGLTVAKITLDEMDIEESDEEFSSAKSIIDAVIESGRYIPLATDEISYTNMYESIMEDKVVEDPVVEDTEKEEENKDVDKLLLNQETIDSIASAVYNKIKQASLKTDSFAKGRVRTLELALVELEDEIQTLQEGLLGIASKVLKEEVSDIADAIKRVGEIEEVPVVEDQELEKLNLNDGVIVDKELEEAGIEDKKDKVENPAVSITEVRDTYKEILREKGFNAAKAYIKDQREKGHVPDNFIF